MHIYPIYKNTRRDIIECATFLNDEIALKAYIKKDPSIVTYIDVANIHLKSSFDPETTLIPGDLFMIPPHRSHMLHFTEDVLYYNCQF